MSLVLNQKAFEYAKKLIKGGLEVETKDCDWDAHQPTPDEVDKFIENHDIEEYAQWFLGIQTNVDDVNSLDRYQLPFGDLKIVHKGAIIDAQKRAAQHGAKEIENATRELLQMIAAIKR